VASWGVLIVALVAFFFLVGQKSIPKSGTVYQKSGRKSGRIIAAIFFCLFFMTQGIAFCQNSTELIVLGPADNILGSAIKEISQSFSDANNVAVNITQVRGREAVVKEVTKNTSNADVVILEKEFPLFNLSGMKKLEDKKVIDNYTILYSERALLVFRKGEPISNLGDLNGMRIAVTDQHVPGACLAKKIVDKEGLNVSEVNASSNEAQLDAIIAGRADATVLWESMFETYDNSTDPEIDVLDLPDYRMNNFIAVLNRSKNPVEAQLYLNYLLAAMTSGNYDNKGAMVTAA
jgi:ABC-type molybdate transport system substrate-binding protein